MVHELTDPVLRDSVLGLLDPLPWPADHSDATTLRLLETLHSRAPVGFGFVDCDFRVVRLNEALAAMTGFSVAQLMGQRSADFVPALWPQLEPIFTEVLATRTAVVDVELTVPTEGRPQEQVWLGSYYPVSLNGELLGIGIVTVDISERKSAESTRRELATIVESSGDAIFGARPDGTMTSCNPAAEKLSGYSAAEVIGSPAHQFVTGPHAIEQREMIARLNAGGPTERVETMRPRKDGSMLDVLITASSARNADGDVVSLSVTMQDITERRQAQCALQASERRLGEAQAVAGLGSFEHDLVSGRQEWSSMLYRILGIDPATPPSPALFGLRMHPEDRQGLLQAWSGVTVQGTPFDHTYRIIRVDGAVRWIHARAVAERGAGGDIVKVTGTLMDDTERIEAARVRRAAETRFESGFEQAGIGAVILDLEGIPTRVNAAVCAILGRPMDELLGRSWTAFHHPDDPEPTDADVAELSAGNNAHGEERRFLKPDGSVLWALLHLTMVRSETGDPAYYLGQLQDITARKQMEGELAHQAMHDSLTRLPNRLLLTDRLIQGLAGTRRRGTQLGVIFLDVDHFKVVNDSLGHTSGDDLLRHAASRITAMLRPGDTAARFGGDEFVVVCDDITASEAKGIAERILSGLSEPCLIGNEEVTVTASLGVALADVDATPESLLRDSDAAMYLAKSRGRARIELFDAVLRCKTESRISTASALHHALEREQFTVHYQPIVDLTTGALVSAEALLGWEHPHRGLVKPDEFVPLAEETGLIIPIGAWVLEQACEQLAQWQQTNPAMSVAVNLSIRQINASDVAAVIEGALRRTGVRPDSVCLELTESGFMDDVDYFGKTLDSLKALGVQLAIDDFGTGYSSLSYLRRFPVDVVKVDRSFVEGLGKDAHDSALVAAILAMADALGLDVVAEGVETADQLNSLVRLQCSRAQGFHFSKPMPAAQLSRLVAQSHHWLLT